MEIQHAQHAISALLMGKEAGLDVKVVSVQLGHSTTTITRDLYQHVRRAVLDDAAEKVVALIPGWKAPKEARS
ncbi:hypothetical protein [Streptosporangium sp. NPDC002524]|uniref:hypothetical protein n=1 Tax=Streptosporangium sp. NPDC002524 TaxID=3154537 RepID=UPI00331C7E5B